MSPGQLTRNAILDVVRTRRGLHKSELARLVGIGWGNVTHHLRVLEDAGLVELEGRGRLVWVFDNDVPRSERDLLAATRGSSARRLLEAIGIRSHATVSTLSQELALSKKVIRHHLGVLTKAGALTKTQGNPPVFAPLTQSKREEESGGTGPR